MIRLNSRKLSQFIQNISHFIVDEFFKSEK